MNRRPAFLLMLVVAVLAAALVVAATSGDGRTAVAAPERTPAATPTPGPSPSASPARRAAAAGAPAGIDPNDPALVFDATGPCVAPCSELGVRYGSAASVFDPKAAKQPLALDLYRSRRTPTRDAPVVVLLHGGGFVEGSRGMMRVMGEQLADAGFLVASVQYRLVPKDRNDGAGIATEADILVGAQMATEDTQMAMRFLRRHARKYGATTDRGRYAVGGYSAGAITALRVALRGGDRRTPAKRRWKVGAGFAISGFECGRWTESFGCKAAYDDEDPPIRVFHGEDDSIVSFAWGRDTCRSAELRGGGCRLYAYPGVDHFWSSGMIFGGASDLSRRRPAVVPTVASFLRTALRKR